MERELSSLEKAANLYKILINSINLNSQGSLLSFVTKFYTLSKQHRITVTMHQEFLSAEIKLSLIRNFLTIFRFKKSQLSININSYPNGFQIMNLDDFLIFRFFARCFKYYLGLRSYNWQLHMIVQIKNLPKCWLWLINPFSNLSEIPFDTFMELILNFPINPVTIAQLYSSLDIRNYESERLRNGLVSLKRFFKMMIVFWHTNIDWQKFFLDNDKELEIIRKREEANQQLWRYRYARNKKCYQLLTQQKKSPYKQADRLTLAIRLFPLFTKLFIATVQEQHNFRLKFKSEPFDPEPIKILDYYNNKRKKSNPQLQDTGYTLLLETYKNECMKGTPFSNLLATQIELKMLYQINEKNDKAKKSANLKALIRESTFTEIISKNTKWGKQYHILTSDNEKNFVWTILKALFLDSLDNLNLKTEVKSENQGQQAGESAQPKELQDE